MDEQNEDYDLLPHKEIFELKRQMEEIKGGPSSKKLMEEMEDLKHTISELIELFKATSQELKVEEKEESTIHRKLDKLASQQKVIAEAILSLSEKMAGQPGTAQEQKEQTSEQQQSYRSFAPQGLAQPQQFQQQTPFAAPESFTPRPFSLGQDMGRSQPFPLQPPPQGQFSQGFGNDGGIGQQNQFSPYLSTPQNQQGQGFAQPPEDFPDLDDVLGENKKKKGILGMFKK